MFFFFYRLLYDAIIRSKTSRVGSDSYYGLPMKKMVILLIVPGVGDTEWPKMPSMHRFPKAATQQNFRKNRPHCFLLQGIFAGRTPEQHMG